MKNSDRLHPRLRHLFSAEELAYCDTLNGPLIEECAAVLRDLDPKYVAHVLATILVGTAADESGARESVFRLANLVSRIDDG